MNPRTEIYEFGAYRLDPLGRVLTLGDRHVALPPKSFDLLLLLVERRGRAVERNELVRDLWPDTIVEEANLTFQISTLRKALGDDGVRWIETVPKHGYRFTAPVREVRSEEPRPVEIPPTRPRFAARRFTLIATVLALALALAAFGWFRRRAALEPERAPQALVAVPLTSYRGAESHPTLSPDGSQLAFSWEGSGAPNVDIYLKLVGPGEPHRLTTDPADDIGAAWSPDGRHIAFLRQLPNGNRCRIYLIPALGGPERQLGEIDLTPFRSAPGRLLAWTPDGRWLGVVGRFDPNEPSQVWLLSPDTGERRRLTTAGNDQIGDFGISFSPDGRFLALLRFATRSVGDVYLLPLLPPKGGSRALHPPEGGSQALAAGYTVRGPLVRLTYENRLVGGPAWNAAGDRIFYSTGGALGYRTLRMLVATDPAHPERFVEPVPLPVGEQARTLASAGSRLVYAREQRDTNIWRLPLSGAISSEAPTLLIASTFDDHNPDISPDATKIAFASTRSGTEEIWIANADGSAATQLTSVGGPNTSNPRWSLDGRTILFNSRQSGSSDLYVVDVATRSIQRLTSDTTDEYEPRWSRDGNWIYFASTRTGRPEVWKIPSRDGPAVQVTRQGGRAAFESADGRWLYYSKQARPESIWRVPIDGGEETKILDGLSYSFNFAVTGRGIYFLAARESGTTIEFFDFAARTTKVLYSLDRPYWFGFALAPDERSILFSKVDSYTSDLMLVENLR